MPLDPNEPNPDAQIVALRDRIEEWLLRQGEFLDEDAKIPANNLTLWAMAFLRLNGEDIRAAEDRVRKAGEHDFAARVQKNAVIRLKAAPTSDSIMAAGRAYIWELQRLTDGEYRSP